MGRLLAGMVYSRSNVRGRWTEMFVWVAMLMAKMGVMGIVSDER